MFKLFVLVIFPVSIFSSHLEKKKKTRVRNVSSASKERLKQRLHLGNSQIKKKKKKPCLISTLASLYPGLASEFPSSPLNPAPSETKLSAELFLYEESSSDSIPALNIASHDSIQVYERLIYSIFWGMQKHLWMT